MKSINKAWVVVKTYTLLLIILLSLFAQASTAQPLLISDQDDSLDLTHSLEFNIAKSRALDTPPIEGWSQYSYDNIQLNNTMDTQWFRVLLKSSSVHSRTFYLEFDNPLIDELNVYFLTEGKVVSSQQVGDLQSFAQRSVIHESFVIPIQFSAGQELEVYFAIHSPSYLRIPITLWQIEAFQKKQSNQRLITGIYLGIVLAIILAILIIYAFNKDQRLLLNGLFIFSLLMLTLTASGVGFHYLWPEAPWLQQHAFYLCACLAMFISALIARKNMQSFFYDDRLLMLFNGLAIASLAFIPASLLLSYQLGLFWVIGLAIAMSLAHISIGVYTWRSGLHEHQDLNYSLLVLLIMLALISVNTFSLAQLPITNLALLQTGVLIQAFIILVTSINNNTSLKADFSEQGEDFADKDLQLSEQMLELQFALKELQEKNEQLEKLNTLDELSGIHNRRHFDKRLLAELRRGRRELSPLSLIMFDIDHFKKFNDTYGHIAGDEVIRAVAFTASEQLNRESDEIFRYGGEEYAIILPNTELEGANFLAEKVRAAIESLIISSSGQTLNCTISLGVACHLSEQALQPKDFIEQADKALYQAKQNGRNQAAQYNQSR